MARPRAHLARAPIAEAVIDFRVSPSEQTTAANFAALEALLGSQYRQKVPIRLFQGGFGVNNGTLLNPTASQIDIGWRYQSDTQVAQYRVDGFTFSKIEPYTSWPEVFGEAFRLWRIYVKQANPRQISRIAVRFINRLRVQGTAEFSRYLEAPPMLPKPVPQMIRDFLSRVHVIDEVRNASAIIVQALEPRVEPDAVSLLLDIDAFREVNTRPDDSELAGMFEQLRELKNQIFYACITEETAEMYE